MVLTRRWRCHRRRAPYKYSTFSARLNISMHRQTDTHTHTQIHKHSGRLFYLNEIIASVYARQTCLTKSQHIVLCVRFFFFRNGNGQKFVQNYMLCEYKGLLNEPLIKIHL